MMCLQVESHNPGDWLERLSQMQYYGNGRALLHSIIHPEKASHPKFFREGWGALFSNLSFDHKKIRCRRLQGARFLFDVEKPILKSYGSNSGGV